MLPSNSRFRGWWWLVPNWAQGRYTGTLLPATELGSGRQMEVQNEQKSNAKKKTI